jgi:hypothetical protein
VLAINRLEGQPLVARIAEAASTPVDFAIKNLPRQINQRLRDTINAAMLKCLDTAVNSLDVDADLGPPPAWVGKVLTGISGGIGGFFGMAALPFELPLTTTLMLRSIAEIARAEGEDLQSLEGRLACLEVFALGGGRSDDAEFYLKYFAVRSILAKLTRDVARHVMQRGAINASSPIVARFLGEIVSRFGFAVTERFASAVVPVIGAVGGAAVNVIFTDHFQRVARGHFVVRRLEREYGADVIRRHYATAVEPRRTQEKRLEAAD